MATTWLYWITSPTYNEWDWVSGVETDSTSAHGPPLTDYGAQSHWDQTSAQNSPKHSAPGAPATQ